MPVKQLAPVGLRDSSYDDIMKMIELEILKPLDETKINQATDRPLTLVLNCPDADNWNEFHDYLGARIKNYKPHQVPCHGGPLRVAPNGHIKIPDFIPDYVSIGMEITIGILAKRHRLGNAFATGHWPCGMGRALGIGAVDIAKQTIYAKHHLRQIFACYERTVQHFDEAGYMRHEYDWINEMPSVPMMHIGYTEKQQRTYFLDEDLFRSALVEGKLKLAANHTPDQRFMDQLSYMADQLTIKSHYELSLPPDFLGQASLLK